MALEREGDGASSRRSSRAIFLACAVLLVAGRLWVAVHAPRLYEFDHYWIPIAQAQAEGRDLWRDTDYHFFPPWAWLLGGFQAAARRGAEVTVIALGPLLPRDDPELAAELLQAIVVDLAELLCGNLGAADLGESRLPESLEDVGDAPDAEADDQHAHHHGHYDLAEPI